MKAWVSKKADDVRNQGGRPAKMWDIFLKRCD